MNLWELAQAKKQYLVFTTIFSSKSVEYSLNCPNQLNRAINWCRETGVTKVYLESFRFGKEASREHLIQARDAFRDAGFDVSGGVTTNGVGKLSSGWKMSSCYTDGGAAEALVEVFARAAELFDELIIDDFFFTDCECEECVAAKGDREWWQYRCEIMEKVGREKILEAAHKANPNCKVILKFPQWYDRLHIRGYDVPKHTENFDLIYAGTEVRDRGHVEGLPQTVQYMGFNIEKWLQSIGGDKLRGGWFDSFATGPVMYVEQAVQTVLGGVPEAFLFSYGSLNRRHKFQSERDLGNDGPGVVRELRKHIPALLELAEAIHGKQSRGIPAYKPASADYGDERDIYDLVGVLGLPVLPTIKIDPATAPAGFFPTHAASDPDCGSLIQQMIDAGKPVLVTDGLVGRMPDLPLDSPLVQVLEAKGDAFSLLDIDAKSLKAARDHLLPALGLEMEAPADVSLYLYDDNLLALDNFREETVTVRLQGKAIEKAEKVLTIPASAQTNLCGGKEKLEAVLPPHTLLLVRIR
ncbi:MAG: hypothetical protein ACLFUS_06910 [Candidatus Sumerlaeia bacterium]